MSLPLKDFRTALPESTDLWLDIEAAATGRDKAAIARDILGDWAKQKAHAHRVASKRLAANGLQPELFGLVAEESGSSFNSAGKGRGR